MLYRFVIELSDIDRGVYEKLDFRLAQHPSESLSYLLTRVFAYALNYQQDLQFSPKGLNDPDAPALQILSDHGTFHLWLEIGNTSARKLHKATKTAKEVIVFTYKNAEHLLSEIKNNEVYRGSEIKIYSIEQNFLDEVEKKIQKNNQWNLLFQQGQIDLSIDEHTYSTYIKKW